jgi:hypothetical protein
VKVSCDFGALPWQMKLGYDARDRCRGQELAVGIQDEQIARPVEDDASARPVLIFVRPHKGTQGGIDSPVAAPACPSIEQPRFTVRRLHYPEDSDVWRLMLNNCGHAVTRPFARLSYVVGLPFCASAFSSSCLTPRASAGA